MLKKKFVHIVLSPTDRYESFQAFFTSKLTINRVSFIFSMILPWLRLLMNFSKLSIDFNASWLLSHLLSLIFPHINRHLDTFLTKIVIDKHDKGLRQALVLSFDGNLPDPNTIESIPCDSFGFGIGEILFICFDADKFMGIIGQPVKLKWLSKLFPSRKSIKVGKNE